MLNWLYINENRYRYIAILNKAVYGMAGGISAV